MRIICFDVGIRNFSFLVGNIMNQSMNIEYIENKDLLPNKNINKISLDHNFFCILHDFLKSIHHLLQNTNLCLIERQLYGKKNYKAVTVYNHIVAHICIFFPKMTVQGFPAKNKYMYSFSKMDYRHRKNYAIDQFSTFIKNEKDDVLLEWFNTFKKKDDISDCFLIFFTYGMQKNLIKRFN